MTNLKEIKLPYRIDPGAPMPEISANEHEMTVSFYLLYSDQRSKIKFSNVLQFTFGSPNEEAINGHRYFKLGLKPYALYQVHESEKIEELKHANRVHPYHSDDLYNDFHHYVFPFHDTTLEVVAKSYHFV